MGRLMNLGAALLLGSTFAYAVDNADLTADMVKAHVMEGKAFCDEVGVAKCVEEIGKKKVVSLIKVTFIFGQMILTV